MSDRSFEVTGRRVDHRTDPPGDPAAHSGRGEQRARRREAILEILDAAYRRDLRRGAEDDGLGL